MVRGNAPSGANENPGSPSPSGLEFIEMAWKPLNAMAGWPD